MLNNFENPNSKQEKYPSYWEKLKNKMPDPKILMASLILLSSTPSFGQNHEKADGKDLHTEIVNEKDENIFKSPDTFIKKIESITPTGDIYFSFDRKNKDGVVSFNPWSILAPAQVELGYKAPENNIVKLELPYKYSRMFNTAEIVNPDDKQKTQEYIDTALKAELAQSIYFLDFSNNSRKVYNAYHDVHGDNLFENFSSTEIESIKITGFTSPEGPSEKGPSTLKPGNIDQENIDLGLKRATDVNPLLLAELKKLGIETDKIISLDSKEIQFSDSEMARLGTLADKSKMRGADEISRIFNLIRIYNNDGLNDNPELEKELDQIIGSKRTVEITINFKTEKERRVVLPLPLTLLLLLTIPYLKGKKTTEVYLNNPEKKPAPITTREIFSEKEIDDEEDKLSEIDQTKFIKWYEAADEEIPIRDKELMKKRMFVDEINRYMDDKQSIDLGLDYRSEIETIAKQLNDFKGRRADLELKVAERMLGVWQNYDRVVRKSIKLPEAVLDYKQDPKKIGWAKIAAKQLIESAEVLHNNRRGFDDEIENKVRELVLLK